MTSACLLRLFLLLLFRIVVCLNLSALLPSSNVMLDVTTVAMDSDHRLGDITTSALGTYSADTNNVISSRISGALSMSTSQSADSPTLTGTTSNMGSSSVTVIDIPSAATIKSKSNMVFESSTEGIVSSRSNSETSNTILFDATTLLGTPESSSIHDTATTMEDTASAVLNASFGSTVSAMETRLPADISATPVITSHNTTAIPTAPNAYTGTAVTAAVPGTSDEPVTRRTTCFPGFQCINGYCLTKFSCECDEGWAGLFCQVPCPDNCSPDGVCRLHPSGEASCVCADGNALYDAERGCSPGAVTSPQPQQQQTATTTTPTTQSLGRPLAERQCFEGFRCVHGYCQFGLLRCVCDDGWVGMFCHLPCALDCQGRGICDENEVGDQYCDCFPEFSGLNCEVRRSSEESPIILRSTPSSSNTSFPWRDPERENRTLKPDSSTSSNGLLTVVTPMSTEPATTKECALGFKCIHGTCVPGKIECKCEPGWTGYFCHKPDLLETSSPPDMNTTESPVDAKTTTKIEPFDWEPIEGHGNLSAFTLRNCAANFVCRYGNCSNGTEIKCDCEPGFAGYFCHLLCPLDCGERTACKANNATDFWCECQFPYTGPNCSQILKLPVDRESSSHWYAVGVAAAVVVILVLVLVVIPYILWKRRNITIMKVVFWLRSYEDNDGRDYDAFVAYASSDKDRQFVQTELIPNLEERLSFTLCIHERDFLPGNYITANINEAVKKSRRTLILVTPSFVKRKWCQFEFEVAVREMVEQKHRILPIILGDIDKIKTEMSDSLKHIISTVTYLQHPGKSATENDIKRFWKKIELSMPKKQSKQSCDPSLVTPVSQSSASFQSNKTLPQQINISIPLSSYQPSSNIPRQSSDRERHSSTGTTFHEAQQPPSQALPGHFIYPTNSDYWSSTDLSSGQLNHENVQLSPNLLLPTTMTVHHLQDSSDRSSTHHNRKSSRRGSASEKNYIYLNDSGVLNPQNNMVTPVYEISHNFLGNQSLISFI